MFGQLIPQIRKNGFPLNCRSMTCGLVEKPINPHPQQIPHDWQDWAIRERLIYAVVYYYAWVYDLRCLAQAIGCFRKPRRKRVIRGKHSIATVPVLKQTPDQFAVSQYTCTGTFACMPDVRNSYMPARPRHYFSHRSSGPPVHFNLGISSDGINAIVTHFIIAKKKPARGFELTPREQAV